MHKLFRFHVGKARCLGVAIAIFCLGLMPCGLLPRVYGQVGQLPSLPHGHYQQQAEQLTDSLMALPQGHDEMRVLMLTRLAILLATNHPDSALGYAQEALGIAAPKSYGRARALEALGLGMLYANRQPLALDYFSQAHAGYSRLLRPADSARTGLLLCDAYLSMGLYEPAFKEIKESFDIYGAQDNRLGTTQVRMAFGEVEAAKHNLNKALEYFKQAGDAMPDSAPALRARLMKAMANTRLDMGMYNLASALNTKAEEYYVALGDYRGMASCRVLEADVLARQGQYAAAAAKYLEVLGLQEYVNDAVGQAYAYNSLGELMLDEGAGLDSSESYFRKALALSATLRHERQRTLKGLARVSEARSDYAQALAYYKRYLANIDSIDHEAARVAQAEAEAAFGIADQEKQIERLESQRSTQKKVVFIIAGFSVFILILVVVLYISNKANRRMNELLKKRNQQINNQKEALQKAQNQLTSKNDVLQEKNEKLAELNSEKDNLMGIVAHDLISPLNKVKGLTQVLNMVGPLSEEQQDFLKKINNVVEGGVNLIRDILDINSLEHAEKKVKVKPFSLNAFMEEQVGLHEPAAAKKHIQLLVHDYGQQVGMRSDADFLSRILDNLLSNAIKFSPIYKNVYVSFKALPQTRHVLISIKDEGQGMSEDDMGKLFRKFQKLSARPTAGENSTGLGLSIIKNLVDTLNGTIEVKSELGVGTEFLITLPQTHQDPAPTAPATGT